jgi:hypothetical protein
MTEGPALTGTPTPARRLLQYRNVPKRGEVQAVTDLIARRAPWLRVRYAF